MKKRRWAIPIIVVVVLLTTTVLVYRGFGALRIVPVTQAQIDAVNGQDLKAVMPSDKDTVDRDVLTTLGDRQAVHDVADLLRSKQPLAADKKRIQDAWLIVMTLQRVIAKKRLAIPDYLLHKFETDADYHDYMSGARSDRAFKSADSLKILARFLGTEIALQVEVRNDRRCYSAVLAALEFQAFLDRSPVADKLDYLLRQAAMSVVLTSVEKAAASGVLTEGQLREVFNQIRPAPDTDSDLAQALLIEWSVHTTSLTRFLNSDRRLALFIKDATSWQEPADGSDTAYRVCGEFDGPTTLRRAAGFLRVRIANCGRSWTAQDRSATHEMDAIEKKLPEAPALKKSDSWLKQVWEKAKYRGRMSALPNSLGLRILTFISILDLSQASFRGRTQNEAHRLAILIARYRALHHGALPPTLAALRPLAENQKFPKDLFADGPFHYDPKRRVFWSVHVNGVDDGGTAGPGGSTGLDIVFRVP